MPNIGLTVVDAMKPSRLLAPTTMRHSILKFWQKYWGFVLGIITSVFIIVLLELLG